MPRRTRSNNAEVTGASVPAACPTDLLTATSWRRPAPATRDAVRRLDDLFQGVGASCPQAARCEDEGGRPGSALQTQRRALEARWTPPWTPSPPHCTSPPTTC